MKEGDRGLASNTGSKNETKRMKYLTRRMKTQQAEGVRRKGVMQERRERR